jgi:GH24 family phage-related lysozyme (muramidase)
MKISDAGIRFIADFEGTVLGLYNDAAGHCTVGIGHLVHLGNCDGRASEAQFRPNITQQQAEALFREDVLRYAAAVNALNVPLNQNQFDALTSFAYNLGSGIFNISPQLTEAIRAGDGAAVCRELRRYVTAVGSSTPLPGLVRRREAECVLYNTAVSVPPEEDDPMLQARMSIAGLFFEVETKLTMGLPIPVPIRDQVRWLLGGQTPSIQSSTTLLIILYRYAAARALGGSALDDETRQRLRYAVR